jgi:SAM-dependent methyltransferase
VSDIANVDQAELWDGHEGAHWSKHADEYDRSLREHLTHLLDVAGIQPGETVLDIGCGNGTSTIEAARAASTGQAIGIDLSSAMLARARETASRARHSNVEFVHGDAQVYPFDDGAFDLAISRFGVMFFSEPVAAFTNIGRALRPGGRVAWIIWRSLAENEVFSEIRRAIAVGRDLPEPAAGAPSPFGLADPEFTQQVLSASGFVDIAFEPRNAPYYAGTDADHAYAFLSTLGFTRFATQDLDDADRVRAFDALRATIDAHATSDGVVYDSACWLVTARRPPG